MEHEAMSVGNGGWVWYRLRSGDHVFVRFADVDDRLVPVELYWPPTSKLSVTALHSIALGRMETWANEREMAELIRGYMQIPGPPLHTLATHYGTRFGEDALRDEHRTWVVEAFWSELGHPDYPKVEPRWLFQRRGEVMLSGTSSSASGAHGNIVTGAAATGVAFDATARGTTQHVDVGALGPGATAPPPGSIDARLNIPEPPYGDDFYRAVADLYSQLGRTTRGPAPIIAAANDVPPSTVRRWVKVARERGFLPKGRVGRVVL